MSQILHGAYLYRENQSLLTKIPGNPQIPMDSSGTQYLTIPAVVQEIIFFQAIVYSGERENLCALNMAMVAYRSRIKLRKKGKKKEEEKGKISFFSFLWCVFIFFCFHFKIGYKIIFLLKEKKRLERSLLIFSVSATLPSV